ncbi:MAG: glutamine amidotransferase [Propionicimonas sp.]|uniref:glutamine amidotransferase n=1 Tax=Propionicimonas sp. TaxID=1955623 RepID=UPI002B213F15|nr:glutamine amidotransferase [Propionicimonas sp.]MEA4945852.1 glutamine amidotransferase [Propionicimonas sp.]MEA5053372.1 glutamine amidotransferase [Propionicimonas sp.]
MTRILLAGESWISHATHYKGFDSFSSTTFERGADAFIEAAASQGITIEQLYAHDVPEKFPWSVDELKAYDAVILSDIGANSFLLPPATWLGGQSRPNRLQVLAEYAHGGGGVMMAGGYLSFQGFQARANFARTPLAEILPVTMLDCDDRVEAPQGARPSATGAGPIADTVGSGAPVLLGYNRVFAKPEAEVVAKVDDDVLIATLAVGAGRSLVWTSDIGPHWCPVPFLEWDGFAPLVGAMVRWVAGVA